MKRGLLMWLASPCCGAELRFGTLVEFPVAEETDVSTGTLACTGCRREYPLRGGIPRLTLGAADEKVAKTRDSFAWEWKRYPGSLPEDRPVLLEESQLSTADFAGKLTLDAGCGMGRYALAALGLGAEVVALDLSDSLERLAETAKSQPRLHLVQGDLLRPPLKPGTFDLVYSHGVLHHTEDTQAAFRRVAALVRQNGYLSVWLYGKAGRYADFKTNPIKADRPWVARHRLAAWLIVGLRHWVSDAIRAVTTHLPAPLVYALCFPLAALGAVPLVKYLTFSVHPGFMVRVIENFDWIAPPYQHHHTKEELSSWFEREGFSVLKVLPHGLVPKPGALGRKLRHG